MSGMCLNTELCEPQRKSIRVPTKTVTFNDEYFVTGIAQNIKIGYGLKA